MGDKMPQAVLTDGCKSMNKALETIMPEVPHRICSWHLMKNAKTNGIKKEARTELSKLLYRYFNECEWEENWNKMVAEHNLLDNSWIQSQYHNRKQWAETFLRHHFFAGHTSTIRCESINSFFKKKFGIQLTVVDVFQIL
ncbi:hypothetical protein M5689_020730 [Euphorbia peplus]|nr:hypothetical protein M5689_020730 [Euphorbia peplus]